MTRRPDLGPILAAAGGAVTVAAVIAGFVLIGGPGDARDRRLDEMTMQRISSLANGVECARRLSGAMPATPADIAAAASANRVAAEAASCGVYVYDASRLLQGWRSLAYEVLGDRRVRICGVFRRPSASDLPGVAVAGPDISWRYGWRELDAPRPTGGRHCYDIAIPEARPQSLTRADPS